MRSSVRNLGFSNCGRELNVIARLTMCHTYSVVSCSQHVVCAHLQPGSNGNRILESSRIDSSTSTLSLHFHLDFDWRNAGIRLAPITISPGPLLLLLATQQAHACQSSAKMSVIC